MPEEAALRACMRVIVVGDIAHVVVDIVRELEMLGYDERKPLVHVFEVLGWRAHAVPTPHHHRHRADLAFGDPADVVFVEGGGDACRLTEVTTVDTFEVQSGLPS